VPPKQLQPLGDDALADLFWEWCEFAALEEPPPDWVELESKEPLQVVGKNACGGRFCLFPAMADYSGRLLYVDSEGRAGVIANSLAEGIGMMLALPTWRDCLKFSGGGKLEEMRKAAALSLRDFRARHANEEANRLKLSKAFALTPMPAPVDTLHRVISEGTAVRVVATIDGSAYEGLFGTFTADSCPSWKQ
jgi:hypothetical protein